jgi:hypothetical protein
VIPQIEKGSCDTLILVVREKEKKIFTNILKKHERRLHAGNVWSCLWLMATMIQVEKYKKTQQAQKQYYYSRTNHKHTDGELRTIIDKLNKLRDTIKEQLKEAKRNREDESELDKICTQIEELQNLVQKARKKIRPFYKPHFSTQNEQQLLMTSFTLRDTSKGITNWKRQFGRY